MNMPNYKLLSSAFLFILKKILFPIIAILTGAVAFVFLIFALSMTFGFWVIPVVFVLLITGVLTYAKYTELIEQHNKDKKKTLDLLR